MATGVGTFSEQPWGISVSAISLRGLGVRRLDRISFVRKTLTDWANERWQYELDEPDDRLTFEEIVEAEHMVFWIPPSGGYLAVGWEKPLAEDRQWPALDPHGVLAKITPTRVRIEGLAGVDLAIPD